MDAPESEDRNKHLEFIQNVISRLATDSFLMKGWAITVAGAFLAFSADNWNWPVAAVSLLPISGFWFLDSYFLWQERLFRHLYDDVRQNTHLSTAPFSMDTRPFRTKEAWPCAAASVTLLVFYGLIVAVALALIVAGVAHHSGQTIPQKAKSG